MNVLPGYGVELSGVTRHFPLASGEVARALDGVDLRVNPGEIFAIVGPSGSGKSTLLRCVAGLDQPDDGEIAISGRTVSSVRSATNLVPRERGVGMVFQDFALYPHMSVADNVAFGLRARKVPASEVERAVAESLDLVEMSDFAERRPAQLSGGQRQRVAVARAIAGGPRVLLFDEPLSNLDPLLRTQVRAELVSLIRRLGITSLFVTHDQEEAMIVGDRLAVLNRGRIEQVGAPDEVYRRPQTLFVAAFTGRPFTNLIEGVVDSHDGYDILVPIESRAQTLRIPRTLARFRRQRVTLHVRPEDVEIVDDAPGAVRLEVTAVMPEGSHSTSYFHLGGPYRPLVCRTAGLQKADVGSRRNVRLARGTVYSPDSGYLIGEFDA